VTEREAVEREQFFQLSPQRLSKQRASLDGFYSQRVVNKWNLLPQEIMDATCVNQFKNRLDKYWQRCGH